MTDAFDISASGLVAQRIRMTVIANNLANVNTTSSGTVRNGDFEKHLPYRRQEVLFRAGMSQDPRMGVSVVSVADDMSQTKRKEYNPEHPHAVRDPGDPDFGRLVFPNVEPMVEMVDMMSASRAYEANVTAIDTLKQMQAATMRILA